MNIVADVLYGKRPFTGQLPVTWPKSESQLPLNVGDSSYDPQYPYGWGLTTLTPAPSGGLSLVDVRRLWPDLLESVKLKRRFTWIMLSQNAQVAAVDDRTLTIALLNAGARDSFLRSGSDEILRQAAIDVIGQDWRVETIVDPSAQPGAEPDAAPRITKSAVSDGPVPPTAPAAPAAAPPDSTPPPDWATGGPEASAAPEPSGAGAVM